MHIHQLVRTLGLTVGLLVTAAAAFGQDARSFPSKPITFIVPFPAGGGTSDILARVIGQKLSEAWGQPVVVENKPGAAGNIGASLLAKAPADGHTIMIAAAAISTAPALYKDTGFRHFETVQPVTLLGNVPFMLVVHPSLPVNNVAEFLDYARKNPNKMSLGSGGSGTIPHLGGELLKMRTGIQFAHVPYKGGIQAMTDLVGGHIQFTIDGGSHVVTQIDAKKVRMLAVTTPQRLPQYPNTPTLAESGLPGFEASAWQMLFVTGGTPRPIVDKIQAEVSRILKTTEVSEILLKGGIVPSGISTMETEAFLRAEMTKWAEVVKVSGAKVD
ncbi:MAG: tripartite tricarboxylate transporter substrate binding protein [Betaproteobacteria bacterium]|nr:tripartite tricarboxylate transporter substrate binding protein [Betaproteobacteria bacterium]